MSHCASLSCTLRVFLRRLVVLLMGGLSGPALAACALTEQAVNWSGSMAVMSDDYFTGSPYIYAAKAASCTTVGDTLTVTTTITPRFPGVTAAGTRLIGGTSFPVYRTSPNSPLIAFGAVWHASNSASSRGTPLSLDAPTRLATFTGRYGGNSSSTPRLDIKVFAVGAAGSSSQPVLPIGDFSAGFDEFPSLAPILFNMSVGFTVKPETCTFARPTYAFAMKDAALEALENPGDATAVTSMSTALTCPALGMPVHVTYQDANDPGNTSDQLTPGPGSIATGVRFRMSGASSNTTPVRMGQTFKVMDSYRLSENPSLYAHYVRIPGEPLSPGTMNAAVIATMSYE